MPCLGEESDEAELTTNHDATSKELEFTRSVLIGAAIIHTFV